MKMAAGKTNRKKRRALAAFDRGNSPLKRKYQSIEEYCAERDISRATYYRNVAGRLPILKLGNRSLIDTEAAAALDQEMTIAPAGAP
jgi:hypothetical protein